MSSSQCGTGTTDAVVVMYTTTTQPVNATNLSTLPAVESYFRRDVDHTIGLPVHSDGRESESQVLPDSFVVLHCQTARKELKPAVVGIWLHTRQHRLFHMLFSLTVSTKHRLQHHFTDTSLNSYPVLYVFENYSSCFSYIFSVSG